ncbi:MAG TPA: hypothetical protein PK939_09615 [Bacteroidales bacterium]|nr:hypothetical protein [Bacteroidales bacterium]HQQ13519.1 hypothetical protein [Bacteroidales bacterium]
MKTKSLLLLSCFLMAAIIFVSCKKDEDESPKKNIATLGAQDNTTAGGFLSVSTKTVYTMAQASEHQDKVDILCFFEEAGGNNIAIAAPGTGITGIFSGNQAPENWTTKNQTYFTNPATEITTAQFDQLVDGDAVIQGYYDETVTSGNRKKKDLKVDDIYAFKTAAGTYGLLKVTAVVQGATGAVTFEYKLK